MVKKKHELQISTKITLYFSLVIISVCIFLYNLLPVLLNYPPNTINTQFDKEVSIIYYVFQFSIAVVAILLLFAIYFHHALKPLDNWCKNKNTDPETIKKVRKLCLSFPFRVYLGLEIFPTLIVTLVLQFTGSHPAILLFKVGILVFSFATLVSSLFLIISKNVLYPILKETSPYVEEGNEKRRLTLRGKLIFQIFPSVLVTALMISLIGYSRLTVEKGNLLTTYYRSTLSDLASQEINSDTDILKFLQTNVTDKLIESSDFMFVEYPDGTIKTTNGTELSHFFVKYMHALSPSHDNRVYEAYTIDAQGVIQDITFNGEHYTVGFYYEIVSNSLLYYFLFSSGLLFLFNLIILFYITKSLDSDIQNVTDGLNEIIEHSDDIKDKKLPITSNDVLGDLAVSFNKIQDLAKHNIDQIHNNQDLLMEKERLASLGQLIGGIAHNLKTPIMSISGAAEGIKDLAKEYDSSIDDNMVTKQDHHEIAGEMLDWIEKIKSYTEYMSDIISAVKGQAVTLSGDRTISFSLEELIKRVDILMKHELKNALIYLNVSMKVDDQLILHGDVNSLVQVINNMISNSIQAYHGKPEQNIDLTITKENQNIVITIQDYATGLPKDVQEKLFKEMVTTKGKNGTGLGLFMSYSNIRAHFNGNITFETEEGKGTTFYIILPIK